MAIFTLKRCYYNIKCLFFQKSFKNSMINSSLVTFMWLSDEGSVLKLNLTGTTASALASYICMTTVWSKLLCQGDVQFRFQTVKLSTTDASGIDPTNFTNTGLSTCYFDPEVTVPTFK